MLQGEAFVRMAHRRLDSWPTPQQESLLRAALLHGRSALEAWEEWRARTDIDHLDAGSYRLLPLLYRNLHRQGARDPTLEGFRNHYHRVWRENQLLFHRTAKLLRVLRENGIDVIALKGAALSVLYYRDCGVRVMDDVDLLVPEKALAKTIRLMKTAGFVPPEGWPPGHVHMFCDAGGQRIDLHWRVFPYGPHKVPDDPFWDGAVPIEIHGASVYALNPSDQLLLVCVHGVEWNLVPTIRWVADAMTILAVAKSVVDWTRVCAQARVRRLTLPLQDTLGYLLDVFAAPIPESVLRNLRQQHTSIGERMMYIALTRPHDLRSPWLWLYDCYRHNSAWLPGDTSLLRRLVEFSRLLQGALKTDHLWQLPAIAGAKALRWIGRLAMRYRSQWSRPKSQIPRLGSVEKPGGEPPWESRSTQPNPGR